MLRNQEGVWIDDEVQLREMVNSFFKNLFAQDNNVSEWVKTKFSYPPIDEIDINRMGRPIEEEEEVKDAVLRVANG